MKSGPNKIRTVLTAAAMLAGLTAMQASAARLPASLPDTAVNTHQSSETVRLVVGRSMVLNTKVPLKRVYVGNPLVLISYTAGANEIVLTAKTIGTSSLMVWDVNGGSKLYTVEVDMDPGAVQDALKVEYPNEPITATVTGNNIVLSGNVSTKEVADQAEKLAENYTKQVVSSLQVTGHPREVRLKVRIAEVDRSKMVQFGVNLLSAGQQAATTSTTQFANTAISAVNGSGPTLGKLTTSGVLNPMNFFYYNVAHGIGVNIQDLAQQNVLQILAEPTLSAMSGQSASFLSGGECPYPTIQASAGSSPVVTISFRPYGIKVDFTPVVSPDGTIRLKVAPEVSSLDYANAVQISGYTIPALSTRRAETQVELKSGQTFMIGGLLDHQTTEQFAHTPGIASIPILGELFKSKNNNHSVTELMVFVTAELVDPNADSASPDPTPAVPSLKQDDFDKQIRKIRGADPNTNRDTGSAVTPVAPQQQAEPVNAAATSAPASSAPAIAEAPIAPATTPDATPASSAPVIAETPIPATAPAAPPATTAPPTAAPVPATSAPAATSASSDATVPALLSAPDAPAAEAPASASTPATAGPTAPTPTATATAPEAPAVMQPAPVPTPVAAPAPANKGDSGESPAVAQTKTLTTLAAPQDATLEQPAAVTAGPQTPQAAANAPATAPKLRLRMKPTTSQAAL